MFVSLKSNVEVIMLKFRSFLWILLMLVAFRSAAQQPEVAVTARLDSTHILVGDHLHLHLSAQTTAKAVLSFQSKDEWKIMNCEVLEVSDIQRSEIDGRVVYRQDFVVTAFDTGRAVIAPIQVWADTAMAACTDTIFFYVDTLPVFVDTAAAFRDIKPPLGGLEQVEKSYRKIWIIGSSVGAGLILIALILVFFLVWWPKLKKKRAIRQREIRRQSSGAIALGHLRELKAKELCQKGMAKEHYSELSVILRTYLDDQWDVNAMEMVTDEIMTALASLEVTEQQRMEILSFLRISDLVKYARRQPPMEENALQMDNVTKFVRDTDQQEQQRRAQQADKRNKGGE
jgi:hypothetical protein